jgi:hypothetical protein
MHTCRAPVDAFSNFSHFFACTHARARARALPPSHIYVYDVHSIYTFTNR